jgi:hypothetical protein
LIKRRTPNPKEEDFHNNESDGGINGNNLGEQALMQHETNPE